MTAPTYKRPVAGQQVANFVHKDAKTPRFKVKFANIAKPFFYQATPEIPRYSVTCIIDPDTHLEFIQKIIHLEAKEGVTDAQILKDEVSKSSDGNVVTTGKHLMKFQCKDPVMVTLYKTGYSPTVQILEEEIQQDDEVVIVFNIVRYSRRVLNGPPSKGLSYQPTHIHLYPSDKPKQSYYNQPSSSLEDDMPF